MTTATFENATSRAVEDAVFSCLRRAWRIKRDRRMPDFSGADFAAVLPVGEAVIEIKGRSRAFLASTTVEIAVKKIDDLRALSEKHGCQAILVFAFLADRSIHWIDVAAIDRAWQRYLGGRRPRAGSANDQEPMILIPIGALTPIDGEWIDGGVADEALKWNEEHRV